MSRKTQQGAAERADAVPDTRPGPVGRLRAQPGFRTAAVVFVLTVVLGLGGPAAYAYWSKSTTATIKVLPTAKLQTPGPLTCNAKTVPNEISWVPVNATNVDFDVVYVLSFTVGTVTKSYAVPRSTTLVKPANLTGLDDALGGTNSKSVPLAVTLRTATLSRTITSVVPISGDEIEEESDTSTLPMFYKTVWGVPNYPCSR